MRRTYYWVIVLLGVLTIYGFSAIPNLTFVPKTDLSPWWRHWVAKNTFYFGHCGFFSYEISPHPDFLIHKLGHILGFGLLGTALFLATQSASLAGILVIILACADEFHQYFVAGRSSRFGDILLDTVAAYIFIVLTRLYLARRTHKVN